MRILTLAVAAAAWAGACISADAQATQFPIFFTPGMLFAGAGDTELQIFSQSFGAGLGFRWNGADRTAARDQSGDYHLKLTAADVARPGLAELSVFDARTGVTVASTFFPVGYNVIPNDVVFDRGRNRFYLATPANPGDTRFAGNSVVALNPDSGAVVGATFAGNGPGNLALSDDGSALYVVVDADGVVRRLNPETLAVVSEFRYRPARPGPPAFLAAIAVAPGNPLTVALYYAPDLASSGTKLAVFDNGVKRASEMIVSDRFDGLLFSPDNKFLFLGSFSSFNTPQQIIRYSVDGSGIHGSLAGAGGGGPVVILDGILYTSHGALEKVDTLEVTGALGLAGAVAVDPARKRILAVFPQGANSQFLQAFDLATQEPLGGQVVGQGPSSLERLIRFGEDGLLYTASQGLLLFHTPVAGPPPVTEARAVVNAAGGLSVVAPGEILSIYGTNLGPPAPLSAALNAKGALDAELGHVQVLFDRLPGTVLLAYQGQLNVIAPFELRPGATVDLQVWYFGNPSARIPLTVVPAAPALFTRDGSGRGLAAVVNQDGTINAPAPPGSIVLLYGTGGGPTPGAVDGALARSAESLEQTVRLSLGGREIPVLYAGAAPQLPDGVFQINARIPADAARGVAALTVTINGQPSPEGVTLEIR